MESGTKEREVIRSVPVPLGEDSEEKGDYMGRGSPWGVSSSSHLLEATAMGPYIGKTSPLGWLEGWWDYQESCGKPGLHS